MRDLLLTLFVGISLLATIRYPFTGILMWAWFTTMNPHQEAYGFGQHAPFNAVIAIVTILAWLFSREPKRWTPDLAPKLILLFMAWATLNSFFAPDPDWSWPLWSRTMKILVLAMLMFPLVTNRVRVHALVWIIALSVAYFGIKGGIFVISTGGAFTVFGPPNTQIADNNQLAVALVMGFPLLIYLRSQTINRPIRIALLGAIIAEVIAILGTRSRGGAVALAVAAFVFWLSVKRKLRYGLVGAGIGVLALSLMPASYFDRLDTISDASDDSSFQGRVTAWRVAFRYAVDHFPFGAGFAGAQRQPIFNHYFPDAVTHAAHSIYFEVLGDHGFPGLAIYLAIIVVTLHNSFVVVRQTRDRAELLWAHELAKALQVSLAAFYIGGAALSLAYYDVYFMLVALCSCLRVVTKAATPTKEPLYNSRAYVPMLAADPA